jgi:putative flippase GtrA
MSKMIALFADASGRFGVRPKEAERFFKFLVVGAIGFAVDFGIFNILVGPFSEHLSEGHWLYDNIAAQGINPVFLTGLGPVFASIFSFIAAVISNFLWNRYWTYPDSRSRSRRRQFSMFFVVSVVGVLIRIPIIFVANPIFKTVLGGIPLLEPYSVRLADNLSLAVAVLVVLFWNFLANRYWTYNDVE